jgi:F0F1-type ATP synthase membrane subunit c/vacuolar-type H+-ATPase subunit K
MISEFEKQKQEMDVVRRESRVTLIFSLALLFSIVVYGLVAYLYRTPLRFSKTVYDAYGILNIVAIVLVIVVLAVRKTIYFSPRLVSENFSLTDLLRRWRSIDIILLAFSEVIAVFGLVITLLGMPFVRTFHFFVAAFLLAMILMPIQWKVRDKIRTFERYSGKQLL